MIGVAQQRNIKSRWVLILVNILRADLAESLIRHPLGAHKLYNWSCRSPRNCKRSWVVSQIFRIFISCHFRWKHSSMIAVETTRLNEKIPSVFTVWRCCGAGGHGCWSGIYQHGEDANEQISRSSHQNDRLISFVDLGDRIDDDLCFLLFSCKRENGRNLFNSIFQFWYVLKIWSFLSEKDRMFSCQKSVWDTEIAVPFCQMGHYRPAKKKKSQHYWQQP